MLTGDNKINAYLGVYSYQTQTVVNGRKFSNIGDRCTQVSVALTMHLPLSVGFD